VFENRVLKRIFGPKREEVAGGRRRLHNEQLHNLYASLDIITVTKSRRMQWTGVCSTDGRVEKCVQNLKGREHSKYLGVDRRIILEWILGKYGGNFRLISSDPA
jgi:hypothetical protein